MITVGKLGRICGFVGTPSSLGIRVVFEFILYLKSVQYLNADCILMCGIFMFFTLWCLKNCLFAMVALEGREKTTMAEGGRMPVVCIDQEISMEGE